MASGNTSVHFDYMNLRGKITLGKIYKEGLTSLKLIEDAFRLGVKVNLRNQTNYRTTSERGKAAAVWMARALGVKEP